MCVCFECLARTHTHTQFTVYSFAGLEMVIIEFEKMSEIARASENVIEETERTSENYQLRILVSITRFEYCWNWICAFEYLWKWIQNSLWAGENCVMLISFRTSKLQKQESKNCFDILNKFNAKMFPLRMLHIEIIVFVMVIVEVVGVLVRLACACVYMCVV